MVVRNRSILQRKQNQAFEVGGVKKHGKIRRARKHVKRGVYTRRLSENM